ncbi:FAD-dependent monooxygenase [Acuticoccus sp.]|uniref:FAD-dependent monooxygenase n=1 Tax=Acuticoccus sp. TaxID=1904378 RepID=UPI003B52E5B7
MHGAPSPDPDAASADLAVNVAVVGAGPVGSLTALAAVQAGHTVALVAPERAHDPRTTALLMPSVDLLEAHGAWADAAPHAAPLITMRIIDQTDHVPRAPEVAFDAFEVGLDQFGFNIANDALNAALASQLAASGVVRIAEIADGFVPGARGRIAVGGRTVSADLVVAADGAQSLVRDAAGIRARRWSYRQAAFVTTLSHERSHGNASLEFHTPSGPFTLVPLPGERSSLVWVGRPEEAERWSRLDPGPLAREIERRAHNVLGRMSVDGPRGVIPMDGLVALTFGARGVVLVGEAAHRFPPIGAQGLNLGFRDVAALAGLLRRRDVGLADLPARYDVRRRTDVALRTASVDLLNRSLLTGAFLPTAARAAALSAARGVGPLRRAMMRFGLGAM